MTSVRRLEIRVDQTGDAQSGIKSISGSVGKIAKVGAAAATAAIGGIALLAGAVLGLGSKLTSLGGNAEEMEAKFDVVFGKGAPAAAKELDEFGNAVGRSKFALMEMASTVQDTFVPLGFARDKAAEMSIELVQLAVDVGSFNNILAPDVLEDFQAALVGETETVRKYGIVINQARIKTKAMEMGLIEMEVSTADVESAMLKVEIAQAKYNETMGGGTVDTEKVRAAQVKLTLANDKASVALQKHNLVLEEHGQGSIKAQESAIRLAAANERVTVAQAKLTETMTGGEVADSKKLAAAEKLQKAEDKLTAALKGEEGALTETAKAAAIMQIIIEGTTDAQGDALETSGSWTNQMLALKESITEGATEMGLMLNEALLPLLSEFVPWIKELMPRAVEVFGNFAEKLSATVGPAMVTIKDAITRIAEAFGTNTEEVSSADAVLAAFERTLGMVVTAIQLVAITFQGMAYVVEVLTQHWANLSLAVQLFRELSFNVMLGAIHSIQNAVITVTNFFTNLYNTASQIAFISFYGLVNAINSIKSAIDTVIFTFTRMRNAANNAINAIPDWLVPGSPTPFEVGLKGINQAAKDINLSMGLGMGERKPMAMAGGGAMGAAGRSIIVNLTYSPVVSLADQYEAQEKLSPFILGALRTAGVTP